MDKQRNSTRLAGALYIIGTIAGILSIAPAVDDPAYLIKASEDANQVILSAFFQFIMAVSYLGIPISLYPIIKKYNDRLALGFLICRSLAAVLIVIGVVLLLLILSLSHQYGQSVNPDTSCFQIFGELLRTGRDLVNHVVMILVLSTGSIMFYYLLFQSKLIPGWLSAWGVVGAILTITASIFVMFKLIDIISPVYLTLNAPMALQEFVFALWLIIKGFKNLYK